jgi:protein-tyrosine phosphatase
MAEGLLKKYLKDRADEFDISSAGISAMDGLPASPETIKVMKNEGVDVSAHRSRRLNTELVAESHKIFVMQKMHKDWILRFVPEAKQKVFLLTEFHRPDYGNLTEADIPDPIQMSDSFYENVLKVIRDCVAKIAESL